MECPECGSERLRWAEMVDRALWGECRHCGTTYIVEEDGTAYEDEDDGYRFDPVTGESRLYREA